MNLTVLYSRLGSEGGSAAAGDSQRPTATTDVFANDTDIAPEPKFKWAAVFGVAFFNLGLMVFVASCGALAIAGAQSSDDSGIVFIALYLLIFAAILFTWEIVQLTGIDVIDEWYKKNFGFLYGPMGKAAYLLL